MNWGDELFIRSDECYLGLYFKSFEARSKTNTNVTLIWKHNSS